MHHCRTVATTFGITLSFVLLAAACGIDTEESRRPSTTAGSGGNGSPGGRGGTGGSSGSSGSAGTSGTSSSGTGGLGGSGGSAGSLATDGGAGTSGSGGRGGGAGTSGASGTLLFDDFEDGDSMGWIANTDGADTVGNWAVVTAGTTKVYKQQTEYSDPSWAVGGSSLWTNQVVEAKVQFVSSSNNEGIAYLAARFARVAGKDQYYLLEFHASVDEGSLKVRKRTADSTTDIIPSFKTGMPVGNGTWYTISLSAVGSTISASLNGTTIGTATDATLTSGGIALGVVDAVAQFDDVKVTAP